MKLQKKKKKRDDQKEWKRKNKKKKVQNTRSGFLWPSWEQWIVFGIGWRGGWQSFFFFFILSFYYAVIVYWRSGPSGLRVGNSILEEDAQTDWPIRDIYYFAVCQFLYFSLSRCLFHFFLRDFFLCFLSLTQCRSQFFSLYVNTWGRVRENVAAILTMTSERVKSWEKKKCLDMQQNFTERDKFPSVVFIYISLVFVGWKVSKGAMEREKLRGKKKKNKKKVVGQFCVPSVQCSGP